MTTTRTRTGLRIAAGVAAAAMLLASCSSSSDETNTESPSAPAASESAAPAPSGSAAPVDSAALACAAYFELDLLNSSYAGGAVADGDMTEEQVRADFRVLLKDMAEQAALAESEGLADDKLATNATRMKKIVKGLAKTQALSDLSKKQQLRFAKSSLRVQKACDRAGFPLPEDNSTARTAAGL